MCGICGIAGNKLEEYYKNRDIIKKMVMSLKGRGPDDQGYYFSKKCILGQARLSIIDLITGNQPMKDKESDIWIVLNGEIYNYIELKKELSKKGYQFYTNSDTEVVLKAYLEYGKETPKHLDGMFSFAIWSEKNKELFIARDRFGQKPFYYTKDNIGNFFFASEIKSLFASKKILGVLDQATIDNYLSLLYVPAHKTVFKNINVLEPGHSIIYKNNKLKKEKYWNISFDTIKISKEEAKKEIRRLFENAVKRRMRADVPLGLFLSGGIDSTIIAYLMQKNSSEKINTFSAGFENHINELPFAKEASEKFGTNHHEIQIKKGLTESLMKVSEYYDEPFADSSNIPTFLISQFSKNKIKVALGGDGSDELFLGYGWYSKFLGSHFFNRIKKAFYDPYDQYIKSIQYFSRNERRELWGGESYLNKNFLNHEQSGEEAIEKINFFDIKNYLPGDILTKLDRSSMMTSLELRNPFLDHHLAEFVFKLPWSYKFEGSKGKRILIEAFEDILPKSIHRKKQGFGGPVYNWLQKKDMKNLVFETLSKRNLEIKRFLNKEYISRIINDFYRAPEEKYSYAHKVWILLCLELWFKNYKKYIKI
ncbi:MAG: asparagine synthase (glutamine-hydrolyzing) [Candidatus Portnoybacteria bacterium]|nr:asparagine synthase (glutamine-hydrolyzing) [Candidatus Portnoybacteria bacterium]